ncbi:hypothetical protein ACG04R_16445 [Roseateles sp. BYS78W]|uniref:Uncharacterized protein n=1 Tax=Pelomonas candidula TaxID=3299025 RepID=A0ABW7HEC8_9BURK
MKKTTQIARYMARARDLKDLAIELEVRESLWLQRGCSPERITVLAAIPAVRRDLCMLVMASVTIDELPVETFFLATLYLTKKSMGWTRQHRQACPLGWECELSGPDGRTYGVQASKADACLDRQQLIARLEAMGLASWAIEELGIEVPRAHVVRLNDFRSAVVRSASAR